MSAISLSPPITGTPRAPTAYEADPLLNFRLKLVRAEHSKFPTLHEMVRGPLLAPISASGVPLPAQEMLYLGFGRAEFQKELMAIRALHEQVGLQLQAVEKLLDSEESTPFEIWQLLNGTSFTVEACNLLKEFLRARRLIATLNSCRVYESREYTSYRERTPIFEGMVKRMGCVPPLPLPPPSMPAAPAPLPPLRSAAEIQKEIQEEVLALQGKELSLKACLGRIADELENLKRGGIYREGSLGAEFAWLENEVRSEEAFYLAFNQQVANLTRSKAARSAVKLFFQNIAEVGYQHLHKDPLVFKIIEHHSAELQSDLLEALLQQPYPRIADRLSLIGRRLSQCKDKENRTVVFQNIYRPWAILTYRNSKNAAFLKLNRQYTSYFESEDLRALMQMSDSEMKKLRTKTKGASTNRLYPDLTVDPSAPILFPALFKAAQIRALQGFSAEAAAPPPKALTRALTKTLTSRSSATAASPRRAISTRQAPVAAALPSVRKRREV